MLYWYPEDIHPDMNNRNDEDNFILALQEGIDLKLLVL